MKRKPIYYFDDKDQPGISEVPKGSFVLIEDRDNGEQQKIIIVDSDPAHTKNLTLRKFMQDYPQLYKEGGFNNRPNEAIQADFEKRITSNTTLISEHDFKITINKDLIDENIRNIDENTKNIGYNRVQIDKNTNALINIVNNVDPQIILNKQNIENNRITIDQNQKDVLAYEKNMEDFHHSPTFGNGIGETSVSLHSGIGHESHIVSSEVDSNGVPIKHIWRIGDFTDASAPAGTFAALKVESIEDIILAVPNGKHVIIRDEDGTNKIQKILSATTSNRPANAETGEMFFDEDLDKPIWKSKTGNWVDATGTAV